MPPLNNAASIRSKNAQFYYNSLTEAGDLLMELESPFLGEVTLPDTEGLPQMNGAALSNIVDGDERAGSFQINGRFTSAYVSDAIYAKLKPAASAGRKAFFTAALIWPASRGATTGLILASDKFWVPDQVVIVPGADWDRIRFTLRWEAMTQIAAWTAA
jgi:hypothetical protein